MATLQFVMSISSKYPHPPPFLDQLVLQLKTSVLTTSKLTNQETAWSLKLNYFGAKFVVSLVPTVLLDHRHKQSGQTKLLFRHLLTPPVNAAYEEHVLLVSSQIYY